MVAMPAAPCPKLLCPQEYSPDFDVTDPAMAPAITGVAVSAGTIQNVQMTRLFSMEEVAGLRAKARQIRDAYKPPGKQ